MCALSAVRKAALFLRRGSRFCHGLAVAVRVCDPHHREQKGEVSRSPRSSQEECLAVQHPTTLEQVQAVTEQFQQHDTSERPHQGRRWGHRRPRTAVPDLPQLPPVPEVVDPARWLQESSGLHVVRTVNRRGQVRIDVKDSDVGQALAGQQLAWHLSAKAGAWLVLQGPTLLNSLPLKGLYAAALPLEQVVPFLMQQARAEQRLRPLQERRVCHGSFSSP
jgi:Integrase core domain